LSPSKFGSLIAVAIN